MRWNQKIGSMQRALLAVEKNKLLKNLFWNSNWQSEQGKKGGKKGGFKNSWKQQVLRKKLGLKYGSQTGIKNQSNLLKKTLSKETIWLYKDEKRDFFINVSPQKSFSAIITILQRQTPNPDIKIKKSSFYKVIHGERFQMYGWSLWFIKL